MRVAPLLERHRADDALHALELLLLLHQFLGLDLVAARQHADDALQRAELFHGAHLIKKIFEGELPLAHLLLETLGFIHVHHFGGAFHETDHVAHAEDARSHALGMERLEVLRLFPHANELDRPARDRLQAQGRTAARVAVKLGQDAARDGQRLIKMRGDVDRLLAGGRVEDEENFLRLDEITQPHQFLHERLVNLQTARRVEDDRGTVVRRREGEGFARDFQHVGFALHHEDRHVELLAEHGELIHGGGAVHIRRHEERGAALLGQQARELAAGSCFARAVQSAHEDAGRTAGEIQRRVLRAEQRHQFVIDDFDDLLAGLHRLNHFRAQRLLLHTLDEIARDLEVHIGVEQRHAHLAQRVADVALGNFPKPAQVFENLLQLVGQAVEHRRGRYGAQARSPSGKGGRVV